MVHFFLGAISLTTLQKYYDEAMLQGGQEKPFAPLPEGQLEERRHCSIEGWGVGRQSREEERESFHWRHCRAVTLLKKVRKQFPWRFKKQN